jgi:tRNA A-37 threonylcarbamoyl transferase component Bud32
LSKYLVEEVSNDVEEKTRLNLPELLNIRCCIIEQTKLYLISDYCEVNLSEFILLHKSLEESAKVAHKLSVAINELHQRDMPHGTLKTTNVYLQNR